MFQIGLVSSFFINLHTTERYAKMYSACVSLSLWKLLSICFYKKNEYIYNVEQVYKIGVQSSL